MKLANYLRSRLHARLFTAFYYDWFFEFYLIFYCFDPLFLSLYFSFFLDIFLRPDLSINEKFFLYRFHYYSMICCYHDCGKKKHLEPFNDGIHGKNKIKGIFIEFLGRAYCHWTEGTGSKKEAHTATEIYLDERQYLFGGRTGESQFDKNCHEFIKSPFLFKFIFEWEIHRHLSSLTQQLASNFLWKFTIFTLCRLQAL